MGNQKETVFAGDLPGMSVVTADGTQLGEVQSVSFVSDTGEITSVEAKGGRVDAQNIKSVEECIVVEE